ncbi:ferrochelatase [Nitratireductor aquimarinus]|uniref:ferrochelatase n=1 Tax=Alphaproteobacteria TaxID=28211 RepID=UPI000DDF2EB8|nr:MULTISPECIES: ferrochelatase [Alphaproteobacteria]MBY6021620.1 ferrochelatase [Nitratireductor sp. DP7N14-4]MBN7756789.1 ferrochelatase [Nitratireductor aquimarinus]MBN7761970.1 ferrochelatase [Nitratireductor aquibiodomus]MBY5999594.1 ferrochelatase [Tritonibacter mobilis]MCV0351868.1 ferrochelatase [Nitratireductor sp.]
MNLPTTIDRSAAKAVGPLPADHPPVRIGKVGVLLVNLGTPDGTDYAPMRRYLKEFLSDRRVIEWPRAIWYPILHGIVLNTRPKKSGAAYAEIWNHERNESPLRTFTRAQGEKLAGALSEHEHVVVDWAMRYGQPSIETVTKSMMERGCDRIVMFPLYPQYSATTTATVNDKFFEALMKMRFQPAIRTVPSYQDEPVYIEALARSIETHLASLDFEPEVVIASYHGIPQSYFQRGDPYHCHCQKTSRLLRERLGWDEKKLMTCFQSRFGPEEWLQPYTDKTVEKLAKEGVKSIAVFNPGFVSDCLETLEEIAGEAGEIFHEAGGTNFTHIPCLNDTEEGMAVIETLVRRELAGWV